MIELERLVALALGEDDVDAEEHALSCGACSTTLERLIRLGSGARELIGSGRANFAGSLAVAAALERAGLVSRTYHVKPGQVVACTVGATDVYSRTILDVDLAGVHKVSVVRASAIGDLRVDDVPFVVGEPLVFITRSDQIRPLPSVRLTFRVFAIEDGGERLLGEYGLDHTAFAS